MPQRPDLGYRPFCGRIRHSPSADNRNFTVTYNNVEKTFNYVGKTGVGWSTFKSGPTFPANDFLNDKFLGGSAGLTILLKSQFDPTLASQDNAGGIAVIYLHGLNRAYLHTTGNTFTSGSGATITYNQAENGPLGSVHMTHEEQGTTTYFQFSDTVPAFWYNTFSYPYTTKGQLLVNDIQTNTNDADDFNKNQGVIYHEIGHTLGVGNAWSSVSNSYRDARGLPLTWDGLTWKGSLANQEYTKLFNDRATRLGLETTQEIKECPLEDAKFFGTGSRNSHFSEHVFNAMQMTSVVEEAGVREFKSKLLFDSMRDIGFNINNTKEETNYKLSDYYIDSLTFANGELTFHFSKALTTANVQFETAKIYITKVGDTQEHSWDVKSKPSTSSPSTSAVLHNFQPPLENDTTYCFAFQYSTFGFSGSEKVLSGVFTREFTTSSPPTITGPATLTIVENTTTLTTNPTFTANVGGVTWGLEGTDASSFSISQAGILSINAAPDFESTTSFSLTVTATANGVTVRKNVTVNVTDVADVAVINGPNTVSVIEHSTTAVGTYSITPVANHGWSVEGTDAIDFNISETGVVTFVSPPDWDIFTTRSFSVVYHEPLPTTEEVTAGNNNTFTLPAGTTVDNGVHDLPRAFTNTKYFFPLTVTTGQQVTIVGISFALNYLKIQSLKANRTGETPTSFTRESSDFVVEITPNQTGVIEWSHTLAAGTYDVSIHGEISVVNPLTNSNIILELPYTGGNAVIDPFLGNPPDYSIINSFLPTMTLEVVEPYAQLPVTVTVTKLAFAIEAATVDTGGTSITMEANQPFPDDSDVTFYLTSVSETNRIPYDIADAVLNGNEVRLPLQNTTIYINQVILGRLTIPGREITNVAFTITNQSTQALPVVAPTVIPDATAGNPIQVSEDGTTINIPFSGPTPTESPTIYIASDQGAFQQAASTVEAANSMVRATLPTKAYQGMEYSIKIGTKTTPYTVKNTRTEESPSATTRIEEVGFAYANGTKYLQVTVKTGYEIQNPLNITGNGLAADGRVLKNNNRTLDIPLTAEANYLFFYSVISNMTVGEDSLAPFLVKLPTINPRIIQPPEEVVNMVPNNMPPIPSVSEAVGKKFYLTFDREVTLAGSPFDDKVSSVTTSPRDSKVLVVTLTNEPSEAVQVTYTATVENHIKDTANDVMMPSQTLTVSPFVPKVTGSSVRFPRQTNIRLVRN